jgi:hypothetical protein
MSQQDNIHVRLTISRGNQAKLVEIIQKNPDLFSKVEIIDHAPPFPGKSIFINYRRSDSEDICGRIYDRLVAEFDAGSVFKDVEDILPGVDFRQALEREVSSTDVMLVLIGQTWSNRVNKARLFDPNDFVRFEIEVALKRGIPVIPLLVQRRSIMPQRRRLPDSIKDLVYRNAREIRPDPDFHRDMDRLIEGIRELFSKEPDAPAIPPEAE